MIFKMFLILFLASACGIKTKEELTLHAFSITGIDNRTPVKDSTIYPYNLVGRVSGLGGGSGSFIAPNIVITAAHVAKEYATVFYPGYNHEKKWQGTYRVKKIVYPELYIKNNCLKGPVSEEENRICEAYDFAFLIVKGEDQEFTNTNYFKVEAFLKSDELTHQLTSIGYGRDNSTVQKEQNSNCQGYRLFTKLADGYSYYIANNQETFEEYLPIIINDCDARAGDSGSPLLKKVGDKFVLVGVQVTIANDNTNPEWSTFGEAFNDKNNWFQKTSDAGVRSIAGQLILQEIKNNLELKVLFKNI